MASSMYVEIIIHLNHKCPGTGGGTGVFSIIAATTVHCLAVIFPNSIVQQPINFQLFLNRCTSFCVTYDALIHTLAF